MQASSNKVAARRFNDNGRAIATFNFWFMFLKKIM